MRPRYTLLMDPDFERRAEERRARLRGGVARSFDELEEAGLKFWSEATYSAKLEATNDAVIEGWLLQVIGTVTISGFRTSTSPWIEILWPPRRQRECTEMAAARAPSSTSFVRTSNAPSSPARTCSATMSVACRSRSRSEAHGNHTLDGGRP